MHKHIESFTYSHESTPPTVCATKKYPLSWHCRIPFLHTLCGRWGCFSFMCTPATPLTPLTTCWGQILPRVTAAHLRWVPVCFPHVINPEARCLYLTVSDGGGCLWGINIVLEVLLEGWLLVVSNPGLLLSVTLFSILGISLPHIFSILNFTPFQAHSFFHLKSLSHALDIA